ncbi:hypothetical protein HanRHA438_Chr16g0772371 [Helianthus annuus]|nr:hypothetical protein HanRHA438_Chr16g0772371 [Helianthus annuus]
MATSPHSNLEVAGSSLARSQCPYGSGFTPRLRLAGWRSARWDHLGGWEDRGISPPDICRCGPQTADVLPLKKQTTP